MLPVLMAQADPLFQALMDLSDASVRLGRAIERGDLAEARKVNLQVLLAVGKALAEARTSPLARL